MAQAPTTQTPINPTKNTGELNVALEGPITDSVNLPKSGLNTKLWSNIAMFVVTSFGGGVAIGLGWQIDSLAWLGMIGFGLFLWGQFRLPRLVQCLPHALVTGYMAFLVANPWMFFTLEGLMESTATKTIVITHGLHLFHGGMFGLFSLGWWMIRQQSWIDFVTAPAIWLICESFYPSMFPMRYGCFLIDVLPLIQAASIFGVGAATLQMFFLASLIPISWFCFKSIDSTNKNLRGMRYLALGFIIVTVANFWWGSWRINQLENAMDDFDGERLRVGVVQGDTEYATFHSVMVERSRRLVEQDHCDLIAWPECALGKYERDLTDFSDGRLVSKKSRGMGFRFRPLPNPNCYLLGGGHSWTKSQEQNQQQNQQQNQVDSRYASAYLLDANEKMVGRHDKNKLMAGGEYTPCADWFPLLADWLTQDQDADDEVSLSRGREAQPIGEVKGISIGAMLCCEDMYPSVTRNLTLGGADLLFCLTNGMAFDSEVALRQHFNIARFRVIEANRYMVRCGSVGVSCLITPTGRIKQSAACFEECDLCLEVPIEQRNMTLYSKWGDSMPYVSWAVLITVGVFSSRRKRRLAGSTPVS